MKKNDAHSAAAFHANYPFEIDPRWLDDPAESEAVTEKSIVTETAKEGSGDDPNLREQSGHQKREQ